MPLEVTARTLDELEEEAEGLVRSWREVAFAFSRGWVGKLAAGEEVAQLEARADELLAELGPGWRITYSGLRYSAAWL